MQRVQHLAHHRSVLHVSSYSLGYRRVQQPRICQWTAIVFFHVFCCTVGVPFCQSQFPESHVRSCINPFFFCEVVGRSRDFERAMLAERQAKLLIARRHDFMTGPSFYTRTQCSFVACSIEVQVQHYFEHLRLRLSVFLIIFSH